MYANILKLYRPIKYQSNYTRQQISIELSISSYSNQTPSDTSHCSQLRSKYPFHVGSEYPFNEYPHKQRIAINGLLLHYQWSGHIDTSICDLAKEIGIPHNIVRAPDDDHECTVYEYKSLDDPNPKASYKFKHFKDSNNLPAFKLLINIMNQLKYPINYKTLYKYSVQYDKPQIQRYLINLSSNDKVWSHEIYVPSHDELNSTFNDACENGNLPLAKKIYYNNPDITINDQTLNICIWNGHNDVINWLVKIYKA